MCTYQQHNSLLCCSYVGYKRESAATTPHDSDDIGYRSPTTGAGEQQHATGYTYPYRYVSSGGAASQGGGCYAAFPTAAAYGYPYAAAAAAAAAYAQYGIYSPSGTNSAANFAGYVAYQPTANGDSATASLSQPAFLAGQTAIGYYAGYASAAVGVAPPPQSSTMAEDPAPSNELTHYPPAAAAATETTDSYPTTLSDGSANPMISDAVHHLNFEPTSSSTSISPTTGTGSGYPVPYLETPPCSPYLPSPALNTFSSSVPITRPESFGSEMSGGSGGGRPLTSPSVEVSGSPPAAMLTRQEVGTPDSDLSSSLRPLPLPLPLPPQDAGSAHLPPPPHHHHHQGDPYLTSALTHAPFSYESCLPAEPSARSGSFLGSGGGEYATSSKSTSTFVYTSSTSPSSSGVGTVSPVASLSSLHLSSPGGSSLGGGGGGGGVPPYATESMDQAYLETSVDGKGPSSLGIGAQALHHMTGTAHLDSYSPVGYLPPPHPPAQGLGDTSVAGGSRGAYSLPTPDLTPRRPSPTNSDDSSGSSSGLVYFDHQCKT